MTLPEVSIGTASFGVDPHTSMSIVGKMERQDTCHIIRAADTE